MYSFSFVRLIPVFIALMISVVAKNFFLPAIQLSIVNQIKIDNKNFDKCFSKVSNKKNIQKHKVVLLLPNNDGFRKAQIMSGINKAMKHKGNLILDNNDCMIYDLENYYFVAISANNKNLKKQAKALSYDPFLVSIIAFLGSRDAEKIEYIFNNYHLPVIFTRATSMSLVNNKKFSFRSVNNNNQIISEIIEKIKQDTNIQHIILLSNKKDEYSKDMRYLFIKALEGKYNNNYLFDDYQLNHNYDNLISKILNASDKLEDQKKKIAVVFFPETGKTKKFECDIDIDIINIYAHNQSMCNALKIFNAVNSKSNSSTVSFDQNKYQFFTGDTFYTFIHVHRVHEIFAVNDEQPISTLSFSLPWYDCIDSKQGWRYKSSYDGVRALMKSLESIILESKNVVEIRNEVQSQLFNNDFFTPTGEKKVIESIIVKIDPNTDSDNGIKCDDDTELQ